MKPFDNFQDAIEYAADSEILNAFAKGQIYISQCSGTAACFISGGNDSDFALDIVYHLDINGKVVYVFLDTGWEYQATREHLDYLELKYGITILRVKAKKPVPLAVRQYGQPWFSKFVSSMINRLQKHNFQWEDEPYEVLSKRYPKCQSALKWWCNANGEKSRFNIERNRLMKEFIIANPPWFMISSDCCTYGKKLPAAQFNREHNVSLSITGVRRAENGIRSQAYKSCFTDSSESNNNVAFWRPLFWFADVTKKAYEERCDIVHSRCYTEYGLIRTGCPGCPFSSRWEDELNIMRNFEPKFYKAACSLFADSYKYARMYREFKENYDKEAKSDAGDYK